ncbi:MAG TPA: serine--tRNA ligase [Candidatus Paceibacterota bacterium]|nr:serine--tRNA ligase [Candidatus Paceibacterota bacterium]
MLDINLIRTEPDRVKKAMKARGLSVDGDIDFILACDQEYRTALTQLEQARAEQNAAGKIEGKPDAALLASLKELKERVAELEKSEETLRERLFEGVIKTLPNIPLDDVPVGADATANVVDHEWGTKPEFPFTPKHYMDIATALGIIDTESAATVSGTRFGYLKGGAALLEFALVQYAVSKVTDESFIDGLIHQHGLPLTAKTFMPVIPPVLIRPEMMRAMGFAERAGIEPGNDEMYYLPKDDLYLVGTSEQSIGPMHYDHIYDAADLPLRYISFSTCFRRESGAAGKDTRGILRVHQFDKLEMFTVCEPGASRDEHRLILAVEEALMQGLGLHYRVVRLSTGDMGQASASTYDIETWMPGQNEYRETHSSSNTTDYQSRALKTRFRTGEGKPELVHMLNGTAFSQRPIIAILEQFQNEDGSVRVPEALRSYCGGRDVIE